MTLKGSKGFSLIEAMIGAGIMGIAALTFSSLFVSQHNSSATIQTEASRSMLNLMLQGWINSPAALQKSANDPLNTAGFGNCFNKVNCSNVAGAGVYLDDAFGNQVAGSSAATAKLYDYMGAPCAALSNTCVFEVYTTYSATCNPNPSPCSTPTGLLMVYNIVMPTANTPVGGLVLKAIQSPAINVLTGGAAVTPTILAWVDFAPGGAILGSYNVSSAWGGNITFTNPLPNANYAVVTGISPLGCQNAQAEYLNPSKWGVQVYGVSRANGHVLGLNHAMSVMIVQ